MIRARDKISIKFYKSLPPSFVTRTPLRAPEIFRVVINKRCCRDALSPLSLSYILGGGVARPQTYQLILFLWQWMNYEL